MLDCELDSMAGWLNVVLGYDMILSGSLVDCIIFCQLAFCSRKLTQCIDNHA